MNRIRLSKYLADCGLFSRRKNEEIISSGKIKVNDAVVTDLSFKVNPCKDKVEYEDRTLKYEDRIVLALNKPVGYLSTAHDNFNRKTVLDLIKNKKLNTRLYPVGRLDYNSRGLLIITNDGELAYKITHPKFQISKVYEVALNKYIADKDIEKIRSGINIEGRELIPINIILSYRKKDYSILKIKIIEGRKRIIRKIFMKLGYKVQDLRRIQIGGFILKDIPEGSYKILDKNEIILLLNKETPSYFSP